jgi:periplasmic copper chaperone A
MKMLYFGAAADLFAGPMSLTLASAHITEQPNEAAADSYFSDRIQCAHGCDGSATVAVRMKIPDGVTSVEPQIHETLIIRLMEVLLHGGTHLGG